MGLPQALVGRARCGEPAACPADDVAKALQEHLERMQPTHRLSYPGQCKRTVWTPACEVIGP
eukprot:4031985-Karenia_brevis.AAC.1